MHAIHGQRVDVAHALLQARADVRQATYSLQASGH